MREVEAVVNQIEWVLEQVVACLEGGADGSAPGLQPYPTSLEREIAELSLAARS